MSDIKQKRLKILNEIDKLTPKCNCNNYGERVFCSNCEKLQVLGQKLIKLSRPRRSFTELGTKPKPIIKVQVKRNLKPIPFSINEYVLAKEHEMTDIAFATSKNMERNVFNRWKKKNLDEINRVRVELVVG